MGYYENIQNKTWKGIYRVIISVQRFVCYICAIALPLIIFLFFDLLLGMMMPTGILFQ